MEIKLVLPKEIMFLRLKGYLAVLTEKADFYVSCQEHYHWNDDSKIHSVI